MKHVPWKKRIPSIIYGVVGFGGWITIAIDFSVNFMPDEIQLLVTLISTILSFMAILEVTIENKYSEISNGFEKKQIVSILELYGINIQQDRRSLPSTSITRGKGICDLLYVTAQSLHGLKGYKINNATAYESDYYVYTRASALVEPLKDIMARYMCVLVNEIMKRIENENYSDKSLFFLIVPTGSNVVLAQEVSIRLNIPLLISQAGKMERDSGPITAENEIPYEYFYRQFHGLDMVIRSVQNFLLSDNTRKKAIKLCGIIVDCNVTSGSTYKITAELFNRYMVKYKTEITNQINAIVQHGNYLNNGCKVEFDTLRYGATLFIAHEKAYSALQDNMKECGMKLLYYFILTEEAKDLIYRNRNSINDSENIVGSDQNSTINQIALKCHFKKESSEKDTIEQLIITMPE